MKVWIKLWWSYEQIWRAESYWGFDSYSEHRLWSLGDIRTRHGYQSWGFRELSLEQLPSCVFKHSREISLYERKFEINEGFSRQAMFDYRKAFACWEKNFRHVHLRCSAVFPVQDIQWVRATTYWNPQDYRSLHITVSQNYSGWCSFFRFHYGFERFSHF